MATNLESLLDEMEDIIAEGKPVAFSGRTTVDVEALKTVIEDIRLNVPDEIRQAKILASERREIISRASREATNAVDDAKIISRDLLAAAEKRSKDMDKETNRRTEEVMRITQDKAREIIAAARAEADRIISEQNIVKEADIEAERLRKQAEMYLTDARNTAEIIVNEAEEKSREKMLAAEKWSIDLKKSASKYVDDIVNDAEYRINKSHQEIEELQQRLNIAANKSNKEQRMAVRHKPEPIDKNFENYGMTDKHQKNKDRNASGAYGKPRNKKSTVVEEDKDIPIIRHQSVIDVPLDDEPTAFDDPPLHDRPGYDIVL